MGRGGDDLIAGLGGNDRITPGLGADVVACGAGVDRVSADIDDVIAKDCEIVTGPTLANRKLALIGQPAHLDRAVAFVDDFRYTTGIQPDRNDVVLIVVSMLDGPLPQTREAVEALQGRPFASAAIFIVDAAATDSPEIQALVPLETRELLRQYRIRGALMMPLVRDDDPNVRVIMRGLLASP